MDNADPTVTATPSSAIDAKAGIWEGWHLGTLLDSYTQIEVAKAQGSPLPAKAPTVGMRVPGTNQTIDAGSGLPTSGGMSMTVMLALGVAALIAVYFVAKK